MRPNPTRALTQRLRSFTRRTQPSSKLEALLVYLKEVVEEGRKALVFSQFTSLLGN